MRGPPPEEWAAQAVAEGPSHLPDTHAPCLSLPAGTKPTLWPAGSQRSVDTVGRGASCPNLLSSLLRAPVRDTPLPAGLGVRGVNKASSTKTAAAGYGPEKGLVVAEAIGEEKGPWALRPTGPKRQPGSPCSPLRNAEGARTGHLLVALGPRIQRGHVARGPVGGHVIQAGLMGTSPGTFAGNILSLKGTRGPLGTSRRGVCLEIKPAQKEAKKRQRPGVLTMLAEHLDRTVLKLYVELFLLRRSLSADTK